MVARDEGDARVKILILGGDGMLGHQLLTMWSARHDVTVTVRQPLEAYASYGLFSARNTIDGVDARDLDAVRSAVDRVSPAVVVNGIGLVKQRDEATVAIPSIEINALFPHRLLDLCRARGMRLVHISTDCVFSGRTGGYRESDIPDPVDLYGRSKLLGEVDRAPGLTLRTSIIGLELGRRAGLIEWFLAQRGMIRGFRRAIYTGLTTCALGRLIERILLDHPDLHGVWQVASAPITKYALLTDLARRLARTDVTIDADDAFVCDRSLVADRLADATGYRAPGWDEMLDELAAGIRARVACAAAVVDAKDA
jgi:dTDP-4-dehydrorhamnose reductase